MGVRRGDEVITPPNSFIASTAAIVHIGAKPVFVDVLPDQNIDPVLVEKAITNRTKAIMPVHLTGRMARMGELEAISKKYNIPLIEDAAQAIGSKYQSKPAGSWGKLGCFSTHPLKNLNACGDGGLLTTNDGGIDNKIRSMRNHGLIDRNTVEVFGYVSRMDTLQASIIDYRLNHLKSIINKRRKNAEIYFRHLKHIPLKLLHEGNFEYNSYHTFVIQAEKRDELKSFLQKKNIETSIHYPIPIHLQPAAQYLGYEKGSFPVTERQAEQILTLPINQHLKTEDIEYVCDSIMRFYD